MSHALNTVINDESLALKIKHRIGLGPWRVMTRPLVKLLQLVPNRLLYGIGHQMRRRAYPYCLIQEGDTVVQFGAPRDLLGAGRSRSIYFALCAGATGTTVIFEPDPENVASLQRFVHKMGLSKRVKIIPKGGWDKEDTLRFYTHPDHPAANVLADAHVFDGLEARAKGYDTCTVPVVRLDDVLGDLGLSPRLISITTNGAEGQILDGGRQTVADSGCYVAVAGTGLNFDKILGDIGYGLMAKDDRGFTYRPM